MLWRGSSGGEPTRKLLADRCYAPYGVPVVLTVVARTWTYAAAAEVEAVGAAGIAGSRRPIAAVVAAIARRRTAPAAGINEVIWERAPIIGTIMVSAGTPHIAVQVGEGTVLFSLVTYR